MSTNIDYTPTSINEIVYHSVVERQLIMDIASGAMQFPFAGKNGILLHGIYGTGKTTLARLLPDAIENAKSSGLSHYRYFACQRGNYGLALMSDLLRYVEIMSYSISGYHYFVLDEVDLLTEKALETLKSLMNMPQTIFIMTTNNISDIDAGVLNRSERINCNAAQSQDWLPFSRRVLIDSGGTVIADTVLLPIIDSCNGSAREIASAMQRLASAQRARAANDSQKIITKV